MAEFMDGHKSNELDFGLIWCSDNGFIWASGGIAFKNVWPFSKPWLGLGLGLSG